MRLFNTLIPKRASVWWGMVYAFLISLTTLYSWFHLVAFPWFIVQAAYCAVIALSTLWVMFYGELSRVKPCLTMMLLQMAPLLFSLVWSLPIWVVNHDPRNVIVRGVSALSYQILLLMMMHLAGIIFGSDVIVYTLYGFLLGNGLIFFDVMLRFGPGGTIMSLVNFVLHGDESGAFGALEVQDLTFAFGVVMIYLIKYTKDKRRWVYMLLSLFFFFIGWKRAAFLGIMMGVFYTIIMERCNEKMQMLLSTLIGTMLVLIGFAYVVLIRSGLLAELANTFGVNMMGRDKIYRLVLPYYRISPLHMGIGYMKVSTITERLYERAIRGLHSDILRIYVELGFPGYFIWCSTIFVFTYRILAKRFSYHAARSYMAAALYVYLTYLTDNTASTYHTQLAWHVMPLAIYLEELESRYKTEAFGRREKTTVWKNRVELSKQHPKLAELRHPDDRNKELLNKLRKL